MSDQAKGGGLAFPRQAVLDELGGVFDSAVDGMTLRDYFAAKALPEVINRRRDAHNSELTVGTNGFDICYCRPIAKEAYAFADAMLAERAK